METTIGMDFFNKASVGLVAVHDDCGIAHANGFFASMVGLDRGLLAGMNLLSLVDSAFHASFTRALEKAVAGEAAAVDFKLAVRNGGYMWAEAFFIGCSGDGEARECLLAVADIGGRKSEEKALRDKEEKLTLAITGTPLGTWDWNVQTGKVEINDTWAEMLGYAREELQPMDFAVWVRLCHPDDLAESNRHFKDHFEGKTQYYECEVRLRHKQGHWVWILDRGKLFERDAKGEPLRVSGTHQDITTRKLDQEQLRDSEERFRQIYENMSVGVAIVDMDFRIRAANAAYCSMLGYGEKEIAGKHLKDITHPEVVEENLRLQDLLRRGEINHFRMEKAFVHKSGATVYGILDANLVRDVQGRPSYFLGSVLNISERKRMEEALVEAKKEFEAIFQNSQVGIMLLRGGRVFARGNQRLAEILGYGSPDEMAGMSMRRLHLDEERFKYFGEVHYEKLSQGERTQIEYQLRRKDGSAVWCILSGKAMDKGDLDRGVIWVIDDLEPRKALEGELVEAKERAEAASQAKSAFLANMSHELRTPLNGILLMQQLLRRSQLEARQAEYVDASIQSASRLTRLLSDILDLSRVEAGKMVIASGPVSVGAVMDDLASHFKAALQEKEVDLSLFIHPGVPQRLVGDQDRLLQVLYNLVGNALKFTKAGLITVEAYPLRASGPDSARLLFSVEDTGIGMSVDQLDDLFEPFVQAENSYQRQYQGAGLGLSICKKLVGLMGGDIDAASREGEGTVFYFCVDLGHAPDPLRCFGHGSCEEARAHLKGMAVLVVEDEEVNRFGIERLMEMEGCLVRTASDGRQALEALAANRFDLVLMDVQMPVMDGVEATRAIRRGDAGAENVSVPIIALTAYAMEGDRKHFLESGMDGYISKSIEEGVFWRELVLALARLERESKKRSEG